ncbi:ubiquinone-dependent pyruvate dehydrogenase [soil metagenome]
MFDVLAVGCSDKGKHLTTVAELLVEGLAATGVDKVWGVVGDALNPFVDALHRDKRVTWNATRHEEAAAFAAGAESQITGRIGVCAGTVGPGALHLVNGLFDAKASHVPVLAITGQVATSDIGTRFHQEADLDAIFSPLTVYNHTLRSADQIERVLGIAIRTTIAERGPALISIPADLMEEDTTDLSGPLTAASPTLLPDPAAIDAATGVIAAADKVTLLVGIGATEARQSVLRLADLAAAPIVASLRGKESFEWDNPNYVGLTGLIGNRAAADAIDDADVLVMVGTDFPYREWLPESATVVQIDTNAAAIGRRTPVDVGIHGDAKLAIEQITDRLEAKPDRSRLDAARSSYAKWLEQQQKMADGTGIIGTAYSAFIDVQDGRLHPELVARSVSRLVDDNAIVTADVGLSTVWAARFLQLQPRQRLLGSFNHASMANALPQALGAQSVDRNRQVVALAGDGGLMMTLGDLRTAVTLQLPINVIVFNNQSLGLVELEEAEMGIPPTGTTLDNPSFAEIGQAMGFTGYTIDTVEKLEPVLAEALATPGPTIIDVHTSPNAVSIPPSPSIDQAWGFATSTLKELLRRD